MTEEKKLLRCPICGRYPEVNTNGRKPRWRSKRGIEANLNRAPVGYFYQCKLDSSCGQHALSTPPAETPEKAIDDWNWFVFMEVIPLITGTWNRNKDQMKSLPKKHK